MKTQDGVVSDSKILNKILTLILIFSYSSSSRSGGNIPIMFFPAAKGLFYFSSHTFTNCTATGRLGPTLANCQSSYASASWSANTNFFNITTQGIQQFRFPAKGTYRITATGALGGGPRVNLGYRLSAVFSFDEGEWISMVVGQRGDTASTATAAAGGGGTFVWSGQTRPTDPLIEPLIVAGGGGGGDFGCIGADVITSDANSTSDGKPGDGGSGGQNAGGSGGNGGIQPAGALKGGGGAGWRGSGQVDGSNGGNHLTFEGGAGLRQGGFGGGGGHGTSTSGAGTGGAGGGGYSGGSGSRCGSGYSTGGGGGSYINPIGTSPTLIGLNGNGMGSVLIELVALAPE